MGKTADSPYTVWTPVEIELAADGSFDNPYTAVEVDAVFEHESGTTYEVPGFWDGGSTWRVRFAPPEPGEWSWTAESDAPDAGLEAGGTFTAAAYRGSNAIREHGFLQVADDGRSLEHDDETPFFWLGDTVWSASAKATLEEWTDYLTKRRSQGYNVVQLNTLPQWDAAEPHRRFPFGEHWEFDSPRASYFQHLDLLVEAATERGMVPAMVALWFNYVPETNQDWADHPYHIPRHPMTESEAARYGRYIAARYGAYGAVWFVSGDTDFPEPALDVYSAAGESLSEHSQHSPCTFHTPGQDRLPENANGEPWLDFRLYQSGHHAGERQREAFGLAEETRAMEPTRPALNAEPCYEQWGYLEEPDTRISREDARRAAWWSVLGGANVGITYGAPGLWHWYRPGEEIVRPFMPIPWELETMVELPGADDYARLKSFLSDFAFESLGPSQSLLRGHEETVRAARLPEDGVVLVYTPDAQSLDVAINEPDHISWFDPATGREVPTSFDDGSVARPPWQGDAVAVIQK